VLRERIAKRGVSQRALDPKPVEAAGGRTVRQLVLIKQGIDMETAKKIVKAVKDSKLKVQAAVQGGELRITGKKRDDLQAAISLIRDRGRIQRHAPEGRKLGSHLVGREERRRNHFRLRHQRQRAWHWLVDRRQKLRRASRQPRLVQLHTNLAGSDDASARRLHHDRPGNTD
jgi:hypothetical protein